MYAIYFSLICRWFTIKKRVITLLRSRLANTDIPSDTERSLQSVMTLGLKRKARRRKASSVAFSTASVDDTVYSDSTPDNRYNQSSRTPARGAKNRQATKRPSPTVEETESDEDQDDDSDDNATLADSRDSSKKTPEQKSKRK